MLEKIDFKKQIGLSITFLVMTIILFAIAVFGFLGKPFSWNILLNHFFFGLALGLYVFILIQFNFNTAFILFILGYVFSFGILFYVYARSQEGFSEAAGLLGWSVVLILVIALGITFEILLKTRKKYQLEKLNNKNVDAIEAEVVPTLETVKEDTIVQEEVSNDDVSESIEVNHINAKETEDVIQEDEKHPE